MGVILNILLFCAKLFCGVISGSIAIVADAFNNLSDAGSSIITLIGFRLSEKKADPHHPFGHGRWEYISGLIVSFMIILMGVELLKSSVTGLMQPSLPSFGALTTVILVISIVTKLYICLYNRKYGKKIGSTAMLATSADSFGDVVSTATVLASSVVALLTDFIYIDAICGLAVSLFILVAGVKTARETISPLLGQPPSPELVKRVEQIALSSEKVIGLHDMIVHDYGPGRLMVSLHCEVSSEEDVIELHEIIDGLENEIARQLNCIALIHMDPVDLKDEALMALRPAVEKAVKMIDEAASFHDLRIIRASGHLNVIFDVLLPYGCDRNEKEINQLITAELQKQSPDCCVILRVENDYVQKDRP